MSESGVEETEKPTENSTIRTAVGAAVGGAAGYVGGSLIVTGAFYAIGLTTLGPIAGGLFAVNMGAGVAAGSVMAVTQSLAMTSGTYVAGGVIGAVAGTQLGARFFGAPAETAPNAEPAPMAEPAPNAEPALIAEPATNAEMEQSEEIDRVEDEADGNINEDYDVLEYYRTLI